MVTDVSADDSLGAFLLRLLKRCLLVECEGGVCAADKAAREKNKCPTGILPSGRPLHTNTGDGGWNGKLAPGLGRVVG